MKKKDPTLYISPLLNLGQITRRETPLRIAFLHQPQRGGGAGPLATLVRERQALAFDLLLYAHTVAPLAEGHPIRATSAQWMHAIGIKESVGNRATVSRSWGWLERQGLVRRHREGRVRGIEILREDGSGRTWQAAYVEDEPYFGLPLAYWRGGYARQLALPAKAVLLIGFSLQSREEEFFELPLERASDWYGLSISTLRRGLGELRERRLLRRWAQERDTRKSPLGHTYDQRYALNKLREPWPPKEPVPEEGEGIPF
ncbi:MAG TPA: hypothetical protein VNM89_10240 [Solirubrobacterales bacterium]|nr:hypothetical protein [Solirubrobacterales bacterium]